MNKRTKGTILRSCAIAGLFGIISYSAVITAGCNSGGSAPTSHDTSSMSIDDRIKAIQASSLPEQQKQTAIAMLKAHSSPSSAATP